MEVCTVAIRVYLNGRLGGFLNFLLTECLGMMYDSPVFVFKNTNIFIQAEKGG
jgi:hypothetical protein